MAIQRNIQTVVVGQNVVCITKDLLMFSFSNNIQLIVSHSKSIERNNHAAVGENKIIFTQVLRWSSFNLNYFSF